MARRSSTAAAAPSPGARSQINRILIGAALGIATVLSLYVLMRFEASEIVRIEAVERSRQWTSFVSGAGIGGADGDMRNAAVAANARLVEGAGRAANILASRLFAPDGNLLHEPVANSGVPDDLLPQVTLMPPDSAPDSSTGASSSDTRAHTRILNIQTPSGTRVYARSHAPVLREGQPVGTLVSLFDLSDFANRIQTEAETASVRLAAIILVMLGVLAVMARGYQRTTGGFLKRLRKSEENYRRILGLMPYPTVVHIDGRIVMANAEMLEAFGYADEDELIGKYHIDLVHPDQRHVISGARVRNTDAGLRNAPREFTFVRRDGSEFSGEAAATPITWNGEDAVVVGIVDLTERKVVEDALRKDQERYRTLLDFMPDGIRINRKGIVLYANIAEAKLLGAASPEDLIGQVANFSPPEEHENIQRRRRLLEAGSRAEWRETSRINLAGERVPVEAAAIPIQWDGDRADLIFTRDISERIETSRKLREIQTRYQRLIDASPDAIRVHVDGKIVFANAAAARLLGAADPDDLVGRASADFNVEEDRDTIESLRRELSEGHAKDWRETKRVRLDGTIVDVEAAALPVQWGERDGHLVINRDITARREAERLSTRLGRIIDESLNEIYVFDAQTLLFVQVNRGATQNLGYTEAELMRCSVLDIASSYYPDSFEDLVAPLRDGRKSALRYETVHQRKDGSYYDVLVSLQLMRSETPAVFAAVVQDISERKQFEFSLKVAKEYAEKAAEEAEIANRAKSEFLATMSHEIRTPMNGILGMASLLADSSLDEMQRDQASVIMTSGQALLTIINDILDFSKLEAGKLDLENVPLSIGDILEGVVDLLDTPAADKELDLTTFVSPELPGRLIGDPGRLRQVILNLTGNAIKFTQAGLVSVRATLVEAESGKSRIRIAVTDTGIGLSEAAQEKLFEKFVQADSSTTRRFGGTGLGLAICKQIVELMDGEIGVVSEEGVGSTFWFELFLPHDGAAQHMARDTQRILVVSKTDAIRSSLAEQLNAWGHITRSVANIADLRALAASPSPQTGVPDGLDIVLLDPGNEASDTGAICDFLDRIPGWADARRILLMRRGDVTESATLADRALDAVLTKPVRPSELSRLIETKGAGMPMRPGTQPGPIGSETAPPDTGLRILLAEDNQINQRVAFAMLTRGGHQVDIAGDGRQAVAMAEQASYDVILMDIQMPNMSGIDATRSIRDLPGDVSKTPIIAMTANAMAGDRETYLAAGMDDYVSKPIDPGALAAALGRHARGDVSLPETVARASEPPTPSTVSEADVDALFGEIDDLLAPPSDIP